MLKSRVVNILATSFCIFGANCFAADPSTVSIVSGNYALKTEITMPHLRESLRYATTQTQQCLDRQEAFSIFPILSNASFVGCILVEKQNEPTLKEFDLVCSNPTAATGLARFVVGEADFRATLDVKMGGKNMKFSQVVSGRRIGDVTNRVVTRYI